MSLVNKLDFGKESAESEQKFLERVFLPTAIFERIRQGKKHLVLGRKGSGKTAVCLRLYEDLERRGLKVSLLTPRDLSKFKMTLLEKGSLNSAESALLSWKYVFFVEIGSYILEAADQKYGSNHLAWPEAIKYVRKFMAENTSKHASWLDKTFKVIRRIKKVGVVPFEAEIDPNVVSQEVVDFTDKIDEITDHIPKALSLLETKPIYILVDKVDELWEPSKESQLLVVGLLRASKELYEQTNLANVITFLRSDIFDALQFHDSDKFHSYEERIIWNKTDLMKLVTLRARASTGMTIHREAWDKIWQTFFPKEIDHQSSVDYLINYTLMRPRDLIQLCNLCRDKAQNHNHPHITADDINEALPQYSKWKLKDLRDEYLVQYPFLERIFLGAFQHSKAKLTRESIVERVKLIKERLTKEFEAFYFEPIDNLLQILYNIGFLGAIKNGKTLYSSLESEVIIAYIQEFEVHPAFRAALDVVIEGPLVGAPPVREDTGYIRSGSVKAVGSGGVTIGGVGGDVIVSGVNLQTAREIYRLINFFNGQVVPGRLLNMENDITLPTFERIIQDYAIPEAGVRLDIFAKGDEAWAIQVKYRELQVSELHEAVSYGIATEAKPWIISYAEISPNARKVAQKLKVLLTGPDELQELLHLIR